MSNSSLKQINWMTIGHTLPVGMHTRFFFSSLYSPQWARASSLLRLHDHTQDNNQQDSSGRVISPTQKPLPDNTQHSQDTDIYAPGGIRTFHPRKRTAADLRLRPRGRWDRPCKPVQRNNTKGKFIVAKNTNHISYITRDLGMARLYLWLNPPSEWVNKNRNM